MKRQKVKISTNIPNVAIRGMGVYCPLATNCIELEKALIEKRDSIDVISSFNVSGFLSSLASAFSPRFRHKFEIGEEMSWIDRSSLYTICAYREAIEQADIDLSSVDSTRVAICLGSSHAGLARTEDVARKVINDDFSSLSPKMIAATMVSHCTSIIKQISGAQGRIMTVSSACASSNSAIGIAADLIRNDLADFAIAGGSDTVSLSVMSGFNALRALSPNKCAPFSDEIGLNLGEGAGIVILSKADLMDEKNESSALGYVLGYGLSGDAHHATAPEPNGEGASNAMEAALNNSSIRPEEVSYVNAHGTGTDANDAPESKAISRIVGNHTPVSSTKGYYGHMLGASGVIEAITSILMLQRGEAPLNLRFNKRRTECAPLNFTYSTTPVNKPSVALVNNFGFGGNNSSLLLRVGIPPKKLQSRTLNNDDVVITGMGSCSAAGMGNHAFDKALSNGILLANLSKESGISVARIQLPRFFSPELKPFARTSATTKYALLALKEALEQNEQCFNNNKRAGLISSMVFGAQKPTEKYMESVLLGNPALANAHYFPMTTMNSTGGSLSLAFQIKGYTTTLCSSASALIYAADLILYDLQDRVAAVSSDEMTTNFERIYHRCGVVSSAQKKHLGRANALGEFGAAIAIEKGSLARERGARVIAQLVGWAINQDPLNLSVSKSGEAMVRAINSALSQAKLNTNAVDKVVMINTGLTPVFSASRNALKRIFGKRLLDIIYPDCVFGYSPSSVALMTVIASVNASSAITLATGYDVVGEAFAFVIRKEED